jgi:DNA-binding XRE family transcriptional regulator
MRRKVRGLKSTRNGPIASMSSQSEQKIQKQFGSRLRELRQQKGLSQEALALACGLDRTYVGSVERGERNISLINIHVIAEALGVPVKDFFDA